MKYKSYIPEMSEIIAVDNSYLPQFMKDMLDPSPAFDHEDAYDISSFFGLRNMVELMPKMP